MTTKYGVFAETAHGTGDAFVDSVKPDPRDHGLNFKVATCKQGKGNDATFHRLQPLFAGEPFVEPLRSALQQKNAARRHNVGERPWRAASPLQAKPAPLAHVPAPSPLQASGGPLKGQVAHTPPNIKAGRANTVAARQQAAHGVAGEYNYIADPVHQATRQRQQHAAEGGGASGAPAVPFRPVGYPKKGGPGTITRHFNNRPKGAVGEFSWQPRPEGCASAAPDEAAAASGGTGGGSADAAPASAAAAAAAHHAGAFKPAAAPRKGAMATFGRYPEYLHDPETAHAAARLAKLAHERQLLAAHAGGAWRPGGQVKSDATRSIMRMNL